MELRNALSAKFGVELAPTVAIDYPTIAALTDYLAATAQPEEVRAETNHDSCAELG